MRSFMVKMSVVLLAVCAALIVTGCEPVCGDGLCELEEEGRCASDCSICGDGICDRGEDCERDCGDDPEPVCGNGRCESGETQFSCPADCTTTPPPTCDNDGVCESGETVTNCPYDCEDDPPDSYCGDGTCDWDEDAFTCYDDCGWCGDEYCSGWEDAWTCEDDCGYCGDGICNWWEDSYACATDCSACPDPNYPVDCGDGTGCWQYGTNCASAVFYCGGGNHRCSSTTDYANCCGGYFVTCPSTHPFYCSYDDLCYTGSSYPEPGWCDSCEIFAWSCSG